MQQLYLDMDGVLADFDKRAYEILGTPPQIYEDTQGSKAFWSRLQSTENFYDSFDKMVDADYLVATVRSMGFNPIVLTGVPKGYWAQGQKHRWIDRMFGLPVICCRSKDKSLFCRPGDIIIDDRQEYKPLWEAKQGHWIVHISAKNSLEQLEEHLLSNK